MFGRYLSTLALVIGASTAHAAAVAPAYTTFGDLAGATFGGTGIPTNPTAITTFQFEGSTITLGLTAHQRYCNAPLSNNGAGVFSAAAGANTGLCPGPGPMGSTWNVGYYVDLGNLNFGRVQVDLLYDLAPGAGTDESNLGKLDFDKAIQALGGVPTAVSKVEGSQNMTFGFLQADSFAIDAPTSAPFNPFASGEYSFVLRVMSLDNLGPAVELGRSAILVNVPVPAPLALLGVGLLGLGVATRRRRS